MGKHFLISGSLKAQIDVLTLDYW